MVMKEFLLVIWFSFAISAFMEFISNDWTDIKDYLIKTIRLSAFVLSFLSFISIPFLIDRYL